MTHLYNKYHGARYFFHSHQSAYFLSLLQFILLVLVCLVRYSPLFHKKTGKSVVNSAPCFLGIPPENGCSLDLFAEIGQVTSYGARLAFKQAEVFLESEQQHVRDGRGPWANKLWSVNLNKGNPSLVTHGYSLDLGYNITGKLVGCFTLLYIAFMLLWLSQK